MILFVCLLMNKSILNDPANEEPPAVICTYISIWQDKEIVNIGIFNTKVLLYELGSKFTDVCTI